MMVVIGRIQKTVFLALHGFYVLDFLFLVLRCSANTCKINLMVLNVLCLLHSEAEISHLLHYLRGKIPAVPDLQQIQPKGNASSPSILQVGICSHYTRIEGMEVHHQLQDLATADVMVVENLVSSNHYQKAIAAFSQVSKVPLNQEEFIIAKLLLIKFSLATGTRPGALNNTNVDKYLTVHQGEQGWRSGESTRLPDWGS